jgi:glycosyltransferase involved in cell wall biosynthesis
VLHLHNYRLVCAIGIGYRDEQPCARCHGRDTRPGVRLRCRGSLPEALVYGAGLALQQPRLLAHADAVVAVSAAQLALLREAYGVALPGARVLPNAVEAVADVSRAGEGRYALVAGRLSAGKGFEVAVRAAVAAGVPLRVAGVGEEEARLRALADGGDVRFLGHLTQPELAVERRGAAVVLAPSRSQDPCPMSVVEALADGVPVLGGDRGGVPELVGPAATLPAEEVGAWTAALRALWDDPAARARAGEEALARARADHAPEVFYRRLSAIYAQALAR